MIFSDELYEIPEDKLKTFQKNVLINFESKACCCGSNDRFLSKHLVKLPVYSASSSASQNNYLKAMVICKNCGHTEFFNAMLAGLVEN